MSIDRLPPIDPKTGSLNAVIECPQGTRNKLKYEPSQGLFVLSNILPAGTVFPFDFGFIPGTKGGDGDPLDIILVTDAALVTGCLAPARLIGVLEAEQRKDGKTERNDRLIAVPTLSPVHEGIQSLDDLPSYLIEEWEHFFLSYLTMKGTDYRFLSRSGPERAMDLVRAAV